MAVPRFVGGPVAQPMDNTEQGGFLANPWVKYGLIAVAALVILTMLGKGKTGSGSAVRTVPDTNNLSTLSNLENAITQDYAQNQRFQEAFLNWLNKQNGGNGSSLPGAGAPGIPGGHPGPDTSPGSGNSGTNFTPPHLGPPNPYTGPPPAGGGLYAPSPYGAPNIPGGSPGPNKSPVGNMTGTQVLPL